MKYLKQGIDFVAFCDARGLPVEPVSYTALMSYFVDYFLRGNTTRTFPTIATRLKWLYEQVFGSSWLSAADPRGYRDFLQARRALAKLDDSTVTKARPLYSRILRMIFDDLASTEHEEFQVLACWTLAHAAIQRLGEVVDGKAKLSHLRCYSSPQGLFFAFVYGRLNKPKTYKVGQAPFAMISERGNAFAFGVLMAYLRMVFGGCDIFEGGEIRRIGGYKGEYTFDRRSDVWLFPRLAGTGSSSTAYLRKDRAVKVLRRLLARVQIPYPEEYSGHSARRGGYVDRLHVPIQYVQIQGHWAPNSATTDRDYSVHSIPLRIRYF